ncbi:MAG: alpha/beta fold hydrolase [Pseudonocardiaceae bacterium]|nr:alpha/beta fold hydrolase [Pseudonocardiaceae bacterium]
MLIRMLAVLLGALCTAALLTAPSAAAAQPGTAQPGAGPPGANDWSCQPSARHPNPIVLTHGLGANAAMNWQRMAPILAGEGYCVFALTYGRAPKAPPPLDRLGGLRRMEESATELSSFVDKVLASTGATKVDIVGHSEGTLMPSYYVRFLNGASKVDKYVSLTPLWEGTTLAGLPALYQFGKHLGLSGVVDEVLARFCGSCPQFLQGSDYLAKLHAAGVFAPEVTYTNIVTRYDEVVIPYTSGLGYGPNVTNIVLQNGCPQNLSEHAALAVDPMTTGHVLNALDPANAEPVHCRPGVPIAGA